MRQEILKSIIIDFGLNVIIGLFIGWLISLLRENAPPFYAGGILLGGVSLIRIYLKYTKKMPGNL